ncbi:hypothetical protein GYMLUDRAFT_42656 [Collybiopsis luxurians FD-317 M1]|uniref:Uncharacterized protein n=1 Tax=Collybiopsis luxurians FD-317 M1 TaxID=944289 RepID=A0A0D0CG99_9AGAR|nr:hypothetical protein GYMLUDRAFT_42656 [Collybiopsis luxurians FD-317 M1]
MGPNVPLLIESFPPPPSFLPPRSSSSLSFHQSSNSGHLSEASSPTSNASSPIFPPSNPPPSLPPTGPLPPVPGRSRISEHEAALILQSSRNSRYSTHSSNSGHGGLDRPDSVASFASAKSNAASYAVSNHGHREHKDSENRGIRRTSRSSASVRAAPVVQVTAEDIEDTSQAYGGLRIDEEDHQEVQLTSLRLSISPMPPSPTGSENDMEIPSSLSTQFPTPPPLSPFALQQASAMWKASSGASSPMKWSAPPSPLTLAHSPARSPSPNESLAEISMHDLPSADDGAESEWDVPTTRPTVIQGSKSRRVSGHPPSSFTGAPPRSESRTGLRRMARISVDNIDSVSLRASLVSPPPPSDSSKSPGSPPPPSTPSTSSNTSPQFPMPPLSSALSSLDTDDADTDLHKSLHRELRSARSRSRSHRERLNSGPTSQAVASPQLTEVDCPPTPPIPIMSSPVISQTLPRRKASEASTMSVPANESTADNGRASPDIQNLLEKTPRPRRSLSSVRSRRRSSTGTGRRSSAKGSVRRRKSDHVSLEDGWDELVSANRGRTSSQRQLAHNEEKEASLRKLEREPDGIGSESEGEGKQGHSYGEGFGFGRDGESDSEASDSSLDLHTPLPNLMLRHGLLSPNSKLLSSSIDSLASFAMDGHTVGGESRPGSKMSMISNTSNQTKSGLLKDARDTTSRRRRHKDGRLLRGGIGLTTGLGWSDSEDEGAPSALTRRISSLNLSRQTSSVSLTGGRTRSKSYGNLRATASMSSVSRPSTMASTTRSSTFSYDSGPLFRSYSSRTLDTDLEEVDEFGELGNTNTTKSKGRSAPPSTWAGKSSGSLKSSSSTLSVKTSRSNFPLGDKTPTRIARSGSETSMRSSASDAVGNAEFTALTPSSTSSSLSIPLPTTPRDGDTVDTPTPSRSNLNLSRLNFDKGLPSLPNPKTGSIRRPAAPGSLRKTSLKKPSESSSTSHPFPTMVSETHIPSTLSSSSLHAASTRSLKQLQLPRQHLTTNINGQLPVPVPGVASRSPSSPSLSAPSSPPTPTTPGFGASDPAKPKSRVGTGMVYRNSPSSNSRMKAPAERRPVVGPKF